jgi:Prealbumin-like fold domain
MAHVHISIVGATLIALFSMTAVATPPPSTSGIEGTIVVSPSRPGPIRKDDETSVASVRNAQFAIKTGDMMVKTFTTDSEGRFQVVLPPGHYVIVREGGPARIGRWRFEADVVPGQVTKVKWTADSGMR